jgi:amidophosphoribosyltransferase
MMECDEPKESCGIFGIYGRSGAASLIYQGLFSLQHRGQEGAGIVVADGTTLRSIKGMGLLSDVVTKGSLDPLTGNLGIGHVRYSTTGSSRIQNVQPLVAECVDGLWAVAHNGNLVNAGHLRRMYQEAGSIFQTSTDSEVLIHLLADPLFRNRPKRVSRALAELKGSFSFLLMTPKSVMAARDPWGFRPLAIGRLGDAWLFASETCAIAQVGGTYLRDVQPGEVVIVDETGMRAHSYCEACPRRAQCVFELVYFARPDSRVFGCSVHDVRLQYGKRLAKEHPVEADVVIAVPDSGNSAALGYSRGSGIPLDYGFIRNHYVGRTFIMPEAGERGESVDLKLAVLTEVVQGKRVVVVDDSIVRGTTAKRRVDMLKASGAKEVHMRISCPPTVNPCFFGIDFPTREELIAGKKTVEEIREFLGAASLGYLSVEGLLSPFSNAADFCTACFTGDYPIPPETARGKKALERE